MKIEVNWSGGYPTLCYGKWTIVIDGIKLTGLEQEHFSTYGVYDTWHFEDWNDVWETYTDGYRFNSWYKNLLAHDTNGLKSSLVRHGFDINNEDFIEDLYEAIQEKDWRHSSCGGCI